MQFNSLYPLGNAFLRLRSFPSSTPLVRTYFSKPRPSLSVGDVKLLSQTITKKSFYKKPSIPRLNYTERPLNNQAKSQGFLILADHCSQALVNEYYRYCWMTKRPYIGLNRDCSEIYIDLKSIRGMPSEKNSVNILDEYMRDFQSILTKYPNIQIVKSKSVYLQNREIQPGPKEGSNELKIADTSVGETFWLFTSGRSQGIQISQELYSLYLEKSGSRSPSEEVVLRNMRKEEKKDATKRMLVRALRKLVADPYRVKNLRVKAGAVDGFIRAEKELNK
jgi:hypothetical protein